MLRKLLYFYIFLFVALFIFGGFFLGDKKQSKVNTSLASISATPQIYETKTLAKVSKVIDGDTIKVLIEGKEETIRLIGIDSPEVLDERKPVQCFGKEASNKAKEILNGKTIILESDPTQGDRDEYGRLLRYIFLEEGTNFNEFMINEGYAHEYAFKGNPYKYQSEFIQAEKRARKENKGLWGSC
jgi:micrococcal nuclease